MANRIVWEGLRELRQALLDMPEHMTDEASDVVDAVTEITAGQLIQSYPLGDTGNLRKGVRSEVQRDQFAVVGIVRSTAPHSHWWEYGTQDRKTLLGWRRGISPSHRPEGLIPIAARNRRSMYSKLVDIVESQGFTVTGTP